MSVNKAAMQNVWQHHFPEPCGGRGALRDILAHRASGNSNTLWILWKWWILHYLLWPLYGSHFQNIFTHFNLKKIQRMALKKNVWRNNFFIMFFSLPRNIPPHPLGGTRVRKHWSAVYYFISYYITSHIRFRQYFVYIGMIYRKHFLNK